MQNIETIHDYLRYNADEIGRRILASYPALQNPDEAVSPLLTQMLRTAYPAQALHLEEGLFLCTQNVDNLHEQAGSKSVLHMHGELFKSRCDSCARPPFLDTAVHELPSALPHCDCGGGIRPHICWFGEVPFELERIFRALELCTVFMAIGTSGVVEPAASFVAHVRGRARTLYIGPEEPANRFAFSEYYSGQAGETLPNLLELS